MKNSLRRDLEIMILGLNPGTHTGLMEFCARRRKLLADVQELVEKSIKDECGIAYARGVIAGAYVTREEALHEAL